VQRAGLRQLLDGVTDEESRAVLERIGKAILQRESARKRAR
jgi:hypothetical protein